MNKSKYNNKCNIYMSLDEKALEPGRIYKAALVVSFVTIFLVGIYGVVKMF